MPAAYASVAVQLLEDAVPTTVLMVLPCVQDIQAAELQQAELDEATAEQQRLQEQHSKAAAAAAKQREKLEADVAAAQEGLKQLQQQGQVWQ